MGIEVTADHVARAESLVAEARAAGGLAPVDLDRFWADDERANADPFAEDRPQVPLGIGMSAECVFAELDVPEDWHRLVHDHAWRAGLAKAYNDKAERIVGRRLVNENVPDSSKQYPPVKALHDIFEAENVWNSESYWLRQSARGEGELSALLDRVERRLENLREFLLPDNWAAERDRLRAEGVPGPLYRGQRGPVTFAASIYGAEDLIYLILDNPSLAERFRDVICRAILERARILDEEAGFTGETARHGWYWCDDNCCLLNPDMYRLFGWPILRAVFDRYSPAPGDMRGQHSDSAMGHLLPLLGELNLTTVNFGPTVMVRDIRANLPRAVIHGQLAPFAFSRNEEVEMIAQFHRDADMADEAGGLVFATAGSINNGSRLSGMRLIMAAIQRRGR